MVVVAAPCRDQVPATSARRMLFPGTITEMGYWLLETFLALEMVG